MRMSCPVPRAVLGVSLALLVLTGCATTAVAPSSAESERVAPVVTEAAPVYTRIERERLPCAQTESAFECDRRAILSMAGDFKVGFRFDETAVLSSGYERHAEQRSGGFETVLLIEDAGTRIELQHILVMHGHVIKHWRQTWLHEADQVWAFAGDQRYLAQPRPADRVAGSWTQLVYEVSDAPRYAGSGQWRHEGMISTWTSDLTWRPLPRREYTKRDDYQVLEVVNRHTITPQGWTHEQDNTKLRLVADARPQPLVRETGFNDYQRIGGYDFSPARVYWTETDGFWRLVRPRWTALLARPEGVRLNYPTNDEQFIFSMFEAAEIYRKNRDIDEANKTLDALFDKAVLPANTAP